MAKLKGIKFNDDVLEVPTEEEKAEWSGKQDKLIAGDNITISDDNTISSNIPQLSETDPTVPTYVKQISEENIQKWNTAVQPDALDDYIPTTQRGANDGVASLDASGKVPISQLPSYVDDVQEFEGRNDFPEVGEGGKIYIAKDTNLTYRWGGTEYFEISPSLSLGETANTAYAGDKGKANANAISDLQTRTSTIEDKNTEQDSEIAKKANADDLDNYIPKSDIKTLSEVGDIGYGDAAERSKVVSVEALSWWNGAYMGENSNLQYFKNGEIAGKSEIPRPLWIADSITLSDSGISADYTIAKKNIQPLVATGYTIQASDKIMFATEKATYLGVVKSTTDTDVVAAPKFDMATVGYVDQSASGGTEGAVLYTPQTLTVDQQEQVRTNIGAGTSNFDGNYSSLSGTPSLGSLASKNTITSTDITDGTIAKTDLATTIQDSLDKADTALQSESDPTVPSHVKSITPTNISTWNSGAADNVKYTTQTLTDTQKSQARTNIGAGTSNFNGQYSSLTGTPTLGSLASKSSIVDADVSTSAAIAQSKIANLPNNISDIMQRIASLEKSIRVVKVIYDMNDSNLNTDFPDGIPCGTYVDLKDDYDFIRIYASMNATLGYAEVPMHNRVQSDVDIINIAGTGKVVHHFKITLFEEEKRIYVSKGIIYTLDTSTGTITMNAGVQSKYYVSRIEGIKGN